MKKSLLFLSLALITVGASAQTAVEMAGKPASQFPHFRRVQNFNSDEPVRMAIDGALYPAIDNVTAAVYVVNDRSASEWSLDATLTDVSAGGAQSFTFANDSIQQNVFQLAAAGELIAYNPPGIGVGYDIVIDVDGDGLLSSADFIDGAEGPGFYVIHDLTQPGAFAVTTQDWTADTLLAKRIWYPTTIANSDSLPLIVISHGWTYNYTMYDYIGAHLASYGYIVMSHRNDVGNGDSAGTQSASLSLIAALDHLLANQDTLLGGVLNGKIDHHHMGWMGHSTGGESPVRAYTRLHDGTNSSAYFTWQDVQYINSMCPVSWFPSGVVNPYGVNYHQFIAGADADVSGMPINHYTQPMTIFERGTGNKHVIYVHGAGHGVFNTDSLAAQQWVDGPDLITRAQLYPIVKSYLIAMTELYCKGNEAGKEFFTRSYSEYRPMNTDGAVIVTNEYRDAQNVDKRVLDDFETNASVQLASSGASVSTDLVGPTQVLMSDLNNTFAYTPAQPSNGMTRARFTDAPHCLVLKWDSAGSLAYVIPAALEDFSSYEFLSFRACQMTRHPFNVALDSSINFYVSLVDAGADSASIMIGDYGPIVQTYQRDGGWQNEFCTVRIRLADFMVNGSQVDLNTIQRLRFSFGEPGTSDRGALGIDDIELVNEGINLPLAAEETEAGNENGLLIYPNPSSGEFTLQFPKLISGGEVEIFNLSGQKVYSQRIVNAGDVRLNLEPFVPEMHFVKVFGGGQYYFGKVVMMQE